ncbi:MAG: hypothetical protein R6V50_02255 [Thermoplasmatota archaeon]
MKDKKPKLWMPVVSIVIASMLLIGFVMMLPGNPTTPVTGVDAQKSTPTWGTNLEIKSVVFNSPITPLMSWSDAADDWTQTKAIPKDSALTRSYVDVRYNDPYFELAWNTDLRISIIITAPDDSTYTIGYVAGGFDANITALGISYHYYGTNIHLIQFDCEGDTDYIFNQEGIYTIQVILEAYTDK